MRNVLAALALCAALLGAGSPSRAAAAPSLGHPNIDGVPSATSFIYPVGNANVAPTWDPGNGNGYFITQGFNNSCDPSLGQGYYLYGTYFCGHTGVDLASATASSIVHATAAGVVVVATYNGGYGEYVRLRHYLPDGSVMYSQYEHMAYGSLNVYAGETVAQGQELGLVGATGFATGAHLHFEIKSVDEDGVGYTFGNDALIAGYTDPLTFVAAHLQQPVYFIPGPGHASLGIPTESEYILTQFLHSYKHYVVVSTNDGLHLRSGPGLHYGILGTTLRGAKLGYVSTQGAWLQVALPQNVRGWVNRAYVTGYQDWGSPSGLARASAVWPPAGPVATVAVFGLNVRSAPGENHSIVSSVLQGDKVVELTLTTNWARVLTRDGARGWVLRRYLHEPNVPTSSPLYVVSATQVLHVRSGPGLQYPVTGAVYAGVRMQAAQLTPHWVAVVLPGGTTGWVARPWTAVVGQRAARHAPQAAHARFLTVNTAILNIRGAPGQNHPIVAQARQGANLQVLGLTTHWAHIALSATRIDGWVLLRYTR